MDNIFIGRQAIYDTNLNVYAYEILYRSGEDKNHAGVLDGNEATSRVILNAFLEMGVDRVAGNHWAFINLTEDLLNLEGLDLPKDRVVLEVLEDVEVTEQIVASVTGLKERGFVVALDDFEFTEAWLPLVKIADIIKLDVMTLGMERTRKHLKALRNFKNLKFLAEKVETQEEFEEYQKMGFDYFQGFFFCKPKIIKGKRLSGGRIGVIQLMAELRKPEVEIAEVEKLISQDAALSFRLLKYLNSPFFGFSSKIESVRQAMTLLGLRPLKTWVTLLAMAKIDDKPSELLTTALVRAKLCELLATGQGIEEPESYFTGGLFSILDALMDAELETILAELPLSEELSEGLLHQSGPIGRVLSTALAYERGEMGKAAMMAGEGVDLNAMYLEAINWSDDLTKSLH